MWNKPLTTSRRSSESSESAGELATRSVESSVVANIFDGLRQRRALRFSPSRAEFSFLRDTSSSWLGSKGSHQHRSVSRGHWESSGKHWSQRVKICQET